MRVGAIELAHVARVGELAAALDLPAHDRRGGEERHRVLQRVDLLVDIADASVCSGICRMLFTSTTQMLRPCVATTISLAVVGWAISWTATVGRLPLMFVQDCAAIDRHPDAELRAAIEHARVGDVLAEDARRAEGRQVADDRLPGLAEVLGDVQVGLVVVRAVGVEADVAAAHRRDLLGSRLATQRGPGSPAALSLSSTLVHFCPPSCVTQTLPSSVPAHSTSAFRGTFGDGRDRPLLGRGQTRG